MLDIFKQQQRGQLVDQYPCFSASGACRHYDTARIFVGDDFLLSLRQLTEQLQVFAGGQVSLYLAGPVSFEVFSDELFESIWK